jgi:hypothetical protein
MAQSGQPAVWNGVAVRRDVTRTVVTGGEAPGEITVTSDWIESVAGYARNMHPFEIADLRHTRELEAAVEALSFTNADRFADRLQIRKGVAGRRGFQVHSLAELRMAADAPMLQAIGPEYRNKPVMSMETEVMNLSTNPVNPRIFIVPDGFHEVDFNGLLEQKVFRGRH